VLIKHKNKEDLKKEVCVAIIFHHQQQKQILKSSVSF